MDLRSFIEILWRHKIVIVVTTVLALTISMVGTQLSESRYRAATTLRLMTATRGSTVWLDYDLGYADRLMNTYAQVARSSSVRDRLADELKLAERPVVTVDIIANTELIKISAEHSDSQVAAMAANRLAEILIRDSVQSGMVAARNTQQVINTAIAQSEQELLGARTRYEQLRAEAGNDSDETVVAAARAVDLAEKTTETLVEQYQFSQIRDALQIPMLTVLDTAVAPMNRFQPNLSLNLGLGFMLGLIGGLGLAFLFENLTPPTISTHHTNSAKQLPFLDSRSLLPTLPAASRKAPFNRQIPIIESKDHLDNQAFDLLHDAIWNPTDDDESGKCLIITSVAQHMGMKNMESTRAFISSLVEHGKRVVWVDSAFQAARLHQFFSLPNKVGLSTLLLQQSSLDQTMWLSKTLGIYLVPTGPEPDHPEELLSSAAMDIVIDILTIQFDVVLINAPALNMIEQVAPLAKYAHGIVVNAQDQSTWHRYKSFVQQQVATVNSTLLGVILEPPIPHGQYHPNGTSARGQPSPTMEYS